MKEESYIEALYDKVQQETTTTPEYKRLLRQCIETRENLEKQLNKNQREQLQKLIDIMNNMCSEETLKLFKDGFKIATKIMTEVYSEEDDS